MTRERPAERTDVLILGSGIAGLFLALRLAERARVVVATKKQDFESNTNYAQGGIAAVLGPDDRFALHVRDTLSAGAGLCHPDVVRQVVSEGPDRVRDLMQLGVRFSRGQRGLSLGREGGHSTRRIAHAADLTGRAIEHALLAAVLDHPRIRLLENHMAVDLIRERGTRGRVWGAEILDRSRGTTRGFLARATVLATGGSGKVYLYTSNPDIATGDGVAMAYRAGAVVSNLEFVQFHPTCLYHPRAQSFLITEAVRGEGAKLLTIGGRRFMKGVHPLGDLAPRDIVARAIDHEMKRRGDKYVLLDLRPIGSAKLRGHFPNILRRCRELGMDPLREPIPVVPAAHYQCGGVRAGLDGRTSLPRLFAIGEVAMTGLHGANRLASNSLLEAVVMAHHAAGSIERLLADGALPPRPRAATVHGHKPLREAARSAHNWEGVRRLMWDMVGIVRSDDRLATADERLRGMRAEIEREFRTHPLTTDSVELRNLALVAHLIVRSARRRKESRGLHYNLDHPKRASRFRRDTVLVRRPGER